MACFLVHIHHTESPFVSLSLFHNESYRNMIIMAFLALSTVFGVLFMTPLMLRDLNALETGNIGLVMFPGAMIGAIAGIMGGRFVDRKGSAPVVYTAMTLLMSGFLLLSTFAGLRPWVHLPEPDPVLHGVCPVSDVHRPHGLFHAPTGAVGGGDGRV